MGWCHICVWDKHIQCLRGTSRWYKNNHYSVDLSKKAGGTANSNMSGWINIHDPEQNKSHCYRGLLFCGLKSWQVLVKISDLWKILSSIYLQGSCCAKLPILAALTACLAILWEQFNLCRTLASLLNMSESSDLCMLSLCFGFSSYHISWVEQKAIDE